MSLNRSILATALTGASGAGGTLIYHHAIPWTWEEVLVKEGCYFLNANDEYKAVWSEHRETLIGQITKLQSTKQTFSKESIQNWCESQLKTNYEKDPTSYTNISNLCTSKGITTVKARLISSGYDEFIDDEEESKKENLYRVVFGIYRYHPPFIVWLKEFNKAPDVKTEDLSHEMAVATGSVGLKSACEFELKRPYEKVTEIKHYTHLSWWCKKFKYEKIKELLKAKEPNWEFADDWTGKAEKWKHNKEMLERYWKNNSNQNQEIEDKNVEKICNTLHDEGELKENDSYTFGYRVLKYVCKKDKKKSG